MGTVFIAYTDLGCTLCSSGEIAFAASLKVKYSKGLFPSDVYGSLKGVLKYVQQGQQMRIMDEK